MGVAGAAVATVVSQAVSGVSCLLYMRKKFDILHIRKDEWKLESQYVKNLCSMGIPMGLQYSVTAIGSVILQSAVNSLGSIAVASMTAASRIGGFLHVLLIRSVPRWLLLRDRIWERAGRIASDRESALQI